ncbi:Phosphoenolpyruvate/pyruvate domain-containing protein [Mollisia scopiformis]|uniref:Phosphoenolpyruvate/pyruvate domain-containing protein n=1 Tax=Mollisia scopiformis TaxID=149040 RepID=A0A194X5T5_MOLSC|nr:Phosphoenolpyruvate/pyruvate domain-containing protein [Mollisia scopiformis]KUJ15541.1 Phosphoenolpyruvate/pyruvate domain-containing protein [Mollisia scopiformis]
MSALNQSAQVLKSLHQRPHKPLVLANVYDILTARAVAELPSSETLATASYSVAQAAGTTDNDLTLDENLTAVKGIAAVAKEFNKPLTVDFQDAYGSKLEEGINKLLDLGVAGINLEDYDNTTQQLMDAQTAVDRIRRTLDVAKERNVPDFVVNARCDVLVLGGKMEEVVKRGKSYLDAGATTVFVWGGKRDVSKAEVEHMVKEFGGRLNVSLKRSADGLTIKELADLGVARISMGPALQILAMKAFQDEAAKLFSQL